MTSNNVEAISRCSVSFRGQFSKFKKLFFNKISKHPLPEGKQIERNVRSDNASEFPKPDYAKKKANANAEEDAAIAKSELYFIE